jgi:hypothetical protein
MKRGILVSLIGALVAILAFTGCTTRSKARAAEQAAFRAGQQQGTLSEKARQNGITVLGPVLNPLVPWTEDLTLAQVIVAAHWYGTSDPQRIILSHGDDRMEMTPEDILGPAGEFPMQPGDTVELIP